MNLGEGRIAEMDAHGIDMQVLSMVQPGQPAGVLRQRGLGSCYRPSRDVA
jgi:hypothetical protein